MRGLVIKFESMREIKFRAWNRELKVMGSALSLNLLTADIAQRPEAYWADFHNLDLMQYTGLKDRSGKEIYEGDIIKKLHGEWCSQSYAGEEAQKLTHEQYLDSIALQYEVVFNTDSFVGKRHICYNPWDTDDEGFTYTRLTPERYGYIEVIGNIYENPELLNAKL